MTERFIGRMARRYADNHPCTYCDYEDLKQSGFFGLLDAVVSFNPDARVKFLTHLGWRLMPAFGAAALGGRSSRLTKQQLRESNALRLDSPVDDDGTMFYDLIEDSYARQAFEDVERRIYNEQLHDALERLLSRINEHYADTVRQIYFDGCRDRDLMKYRERSLNALRRYPNKKELEQFLDFYVIPSGRGLRPTEQTVIRRDDVEQRFKRKGMIKEAGI